MVVTADLVAEVERQFAESEIESVISLLGELDSARVQRAVVRLADGDIDRLLHFIARAQEDSRDAIFWAEEPRSDDEPATWEELRVRLQLPPE